MGAKRCSYPHPHDPGAFGNDSGASSVSNHSGASSVSNHADTCAFGLYSPGRTDGSGNACNSGNAFRSSASGSGRSQPAF